MPSQGQADSSPGTGCPYRCHKTHPSSQQSPLQRKAKKPQPCLSMPRVNQVQAGLLGFAGLPRQEPRAARAASCTALCPGLGAWGSCCTMEWRASKGWGCRAAGVPSCTHTACPSSDSPMHRPTRAGKLVGKGAGGVPGSGQLAENRVRTSK